MVKKKIKKIVKNLVKPRYTKLNALKLGFAGGIVFAILVAIPTIAGIYGYFQVYNSIIVNIYGSFGYSLTWLGVFLGAFYGFIDGFVFSWLFAFVYNKLL